MVQKRRTVYLCVRVFNTEIFTTRSGRPYLCHAVPCYGLKARSSEAVQSKYKLEDKRGGKRARGRVGAHTMIATYDQILEDGLIAESVESLIKRKIRRRLIKALKYTYLFFDLGIRESGDEAKFEYEPNHEGTELIRYIRIPAQPILILFAQLICLPNADEITGSRIDLCLPGANAPYPHFLGTLAK